MKLEQNVSYNIELQKSEKRELQAGLHFVLVEIEQLKLPPKRDCGEFQHYLDVLGRFQTLLANDVGEIIL